MTQKAGNKSFLQAFAAEPDRVLAASSAVIAIVLTAWMTLHIGRSIYTIAGLLVFAASVGYLFLSRRASHKDIRLSPASWRILNIAFVGVFTYSLLAVHFRPDIYSRPDSYFIAVSVLVGLLVIEVVFLPPQRTYALLSLAKIIAVYLSIVLTQLLIFPEVVGIDPWYHQEFTLDILESGFVPGGNAYSLMPGMHLLVGATSLMTGLSYKLASIFSVSLLHILCTTLLVFLIGNAIYNRKAGLLAALFVMLGNYNLFFSYVAIPNTMAVTIIVVTVYLLFKVRQKHRTAGLVLSLLLMSVLLVTHTLAALALLGLLGIFWLGFRLYDWIPALARSGRRAASRRADPVSPVPLYLVLTFGLATFLWWNQTGHLGYLTGSAESGFASQVVTPPAVKAAEYSISTPFTEQVTTQIGFLLLFILSFLGIFHLASRNTRYKYALLISAGGFVMLAIAFVGVIAGRNILVERWLLVAQVLLAIPLGIGILFLAGAIRRARAKVFALLFLVLPITFFTFISPLASIDNNSIARNTKIRLALSESEMEAVRSMQRLAAGAVGLDQYAHSVADHTYDGVEAVDLSDQFSSGDFHLLDGVTVVVRDQVAHHTFFMSGIYKLNYDPFQTLELQDFSGIYDSGSTHSFVPKGPIIRPDQSSDFNKDPPFNSAGPGGGTDAR